VSYFPHLIAGPILHHSEMMPQFADTRTYRFDATNFSIGAVFFFVGLFKKVVLADGVQPFVGPVFDVDPSYRLTFIEAWIRALSCRPRSSLSSSRLTPTWPSAWQSFSTSTCRSTSTRRTRLTTSSISGGAGT